MRACKNIITVPSGHWPVVSSCGNELTPFFPACYKRVLYACSGLRTRTSFMSVTGNSCSDAAKLNPVWKWKRVRIPAGPPPAPQVVVWAKLVLEGSA